MTLPFFLFVTLTQLLKLTLAPPPINPNELLAEQVRLSLERRKMPNELVRVGKPLTAVDLQRYQPNNETKSVDPTRNGSLFEGDIDLDEFPTRNAVKDVNLRWPRAVVPYLISEEFSDKERSNLAKAMYEFHLRTCVRFLPRTHEDNYVYIRRGRSVCSSSVGRRGGQQSIRLGKGCVSTPGIPMHEFMHALGFWHEQSRADRDRNILVVWDNIIPGKEYNFLKYDLTTIDHLNTAYDVNSILHYGPYSFSVDSSSPTLVNLYPRKSDRMGQRKVLTNNDVLKVNRMYCGQRRG